MDELASILNTRLVDQSEILPQANLWQPFCAAIEDGNPLYWDEAQAAPLTGTLICPPAMLTAWNRPASWSPEKSPGWAGQAGKRPLELHHRLKEHFAYPYGVVEETELNVFAPLHAGEALSAEQSVVECQEERTTRLGQGRSWTIEVIYRKQDGSAVASERTRLFAYRT